MAERAPHQMPSAHRRLVGRAMMALMLIVCAATMGAGLHPPPAGAAGSALRPAGYAVVRPDVTLIFPRDHGAHPDFRTEWWYVTGWLDVPGEGSKGFQITFFRQANADAAQSRSRFAPRQLMLAHGALADEATGFLHDARVARGGFGLAGAKIGDAAMAIDDWRMARLADGRWAARVTIRGITLSLVLTPTQPLILQGRGGYSRKGPEPAQASHYYSLPQLAVSGRLVRNGRAVAVGGRAWLDHEWSSTLMDRRAVGWDWVGLNLADGSALTAFRLRDRLGGVLWAGGSWRPAGGKLVELGPRDVRFLARRHWRSLRSGGVYPVDPVVRVELPEGVRDFALTPLRVDQELVDGFGPTYWEGAVTSREESDGGGGRATGRGYLELTGYADPLKF